MLETLIFTESEMTGIQIRQTYKNLILKNN